MAKKIFVIDDDAGIVDALCLILEDEGYIAFSTTKGDEVLEVVKTFKPDLILLDILMSGKDGRDICRGLKGNEKTRHIPVIMMSAHPTARQGALDCGADDFLAKPFDTQDLLELIKVHGTS